MIASRTGGRFPLYFGISLMILAIFFILNICLGSVPIPPGQVVKVLFGMGSEQATWENIILQFRMPKAITAVLVGSGLGVSGLLMQTLFRNPLAEPFVLGISSGASLGVALTILN